MRRIIPVNSGWRFKKDDDPDEAFTIVDLPHTNLELPLNCFDEEDYQFKSTYEIELSILPEYSGKRLFLDFEGVMLTAEVFLNGNPAGEHRGGFTPFSVEITDLVEYGKNNILTVKTDASENENIPPFGKVVDYLTYGGIYREVFLRVNECIYVEDTFIVTDRILEETKDIAVELTTHSLRAGENFAVSIVVFRRDDPADVKITRKTILKDVKAGRNVHYIRLDDIAGIELWDIKKPVLYNFEIILSENDAVMDEVQITTGFRHAVFRPDGFYLNGRFLRIRGLNRHQSFPYAGYAMPERVQKQDADILKYEMGLNLVRTSHYPQSRHFHDRCDEIGLLVFEELPGWQHIGGEVWKENAVNSLKEMIIRDRNRPSVIIWGVRINESQDDHNFYTRTNSLARELDPTRQTGGVRYIENSELLEDVYTMNDFVHSGNTEPERILRTPEKVTKLKKGGKCPVPYLVTEYNGHMYPTKRFDNEERTREHALRHLRVIDRVGLDKSISGTIGWCAFDYNTHREFGSGDRICYHGVSDMFRIPKTAAAVYSSQKEPSEGIVLEPATLFAKGERSAASLLPIEVYTNCDFIKLYRNGNEIGNFYPARDEYPGIDHPPVIIKDFVGKQLDNSEFSEKDVALIRKMISYVMLNGEEALKPSHMLKLGIFMKKYNLKYEDIVSLFLKFSAGWGDSEDVFEIAGYVKQEEVVRRRFGSGSLHQLYIKADSDTLESNRSSWDAVRLEFRLLDQFGNILPFCSDYLKINVSGPAKVIGPALTSFTGGVAAAWIRTTGSPGTVTVTAECSRMTSEEITITVS